MHQWRRRGAKIHRILSLLVVLLLGLELVYKNLLLLVLLLGLQLVDKDLCLLVLLLGLLLQMLS